MIAYESGYQGKEREAICAFCTLIMALILIELKANIPNALAMIPLILGFSSKLKLSIPFKLELS